MQGNKRKYSNVLRKFILVGLGIFYLTSCSQKKVVLQPYEPKPPEIKESNFKSPPGSLYAGGDNLFTDDKAFQVGDIITIKVVENITGSGSANTNSNRKTKVGLDFPSPIIMGKQVPNKTPIAGITTNSNSSFQGQGNTSRNAKLIATISARVEKVYPNGNLYIVGKKILRINNDNQVLVVAGMVKPTYVQQDNSVLSTQLSDAYIEYNGKGFVADSEEPGWLTKILVKIWPF